MKINKIISSILVLSSLFLTSCGSSTDNNKENYGTEITFEEFIEAKDLAYSNTKTFWPYQYVEIKPVSPAGKYAWAFKSSTSTNNFAYTSNSPLTVNGSPSGASVKYLTSPYDSTGNTIYYYIIGDQDLAFRKSITSEDELGDNLYGRNISRTCTYSYYKDETTYTCIVNRSGTVLINVFDKDTFVFLKRSIACYGGSVGNSDDECTYNWVTRETSSN